MATPRPQCPGQARPLAERGHSWLAPSALAVLAALLAATASRALAGQPRPDAPLLAKKTAEPMDLSREAEVAVEQRREEAKVFAARGRQALAAGAYAEARDAFREALRLDPNDGASRKLLAEAQTVLSLGPNAELLARMREQEAFRTQTLLRQIDFHLFEGQRAITARDYEAAMEHAESALGSLRFVSDAARAAAARRRAEKLRTDARAGAERAAQHPGNPAKARTDGARAAAKKDPLISAGPAPLGSPAARKASRDRAGELLVEAEREGIPPDPAKVVLPSKERAARRRPFGQPMEKWELDLRAKLAQPVSLEFHGTPLPEAVKQLSTLGGISIVLDPKVADQAASVTIPKSHMPLEAVVRWVARFGGLQYCLRDGAVLLTTRGGLFHEPLQRVYDVSGFLTGPEDGEPLVFRGPVEPLAHPAAVKKTAPADPDTLGQGWVDFIRSTIAAGTWADGAVLQEKTPFTIAYRNGRIVVVHTPEVHEQIEDLLNSFRKARNLQVHVMARFISITKASLDTLNFGYSLDTLADSSSRTIASIVSATGVSDLGRIPNYNNAGGLDMTIRYMKDDAAAAFIKAVLKEMQGTVLTAPRLTMFNTQRANLQVLTNHNYIRRVTGDDVPEIGNIPEGTIFDVQPFVSADRRYITLVMQPQMRDLLSLVDYHFLTRTLLTETANINVLIPYEVHIQIPTTRLRSIGTTVTVPNGGTLLLSGFAEVEENAGVATLPFFEGLPLLRYIVRGWDRNEGRQSLVILVTAQTVEDIFEE